MNAFVRGHKLDFKTFTIFCKISIRILEINFWSSYDLWTFWQLIQVHSKLILEVVPKTILPDDLTVQLSHFKCVIRWMNSSIIMRGSKGQNIIIHPILMVILLCFPSLSHFFYHFFFFQMAISQLNQAKSSWNFQKKTSCG